MKPASATLFSLCLLVLLASPSAIAQQAARWFQIEVSVFSNENPSDREAEVWQPKGQQLAYPSTTRRLQEIMDLLMLSDLRPVTAATTVLPDPSTLPTLEPTAADIISATGPFPAKARGEFRFYDFDRDSFLTLPTSASSFVQTNRAIERAADHRLLFHGLWRQPVVGANAATPIYIHGGRQYGAQHELQGTLTIRFNANADRVVVDSDLWLSEFSIVGDRENNWQLPAVPARLRRDFDRAGAETELTYQILRTYRLKQSRDMRSTEFHYIDHPALGFVIMVQPYEVPPVPFSDFGIAPSQ